MPSSFWYAIIELISTHHIIIDRPKGQPHPRYPELIYPLDYGYLEGTSASDGGGIDVWLGSLVIKTITGILCTFDTLKCDAEIKILLGCTEKDNRLIKKFYSHEMKTLFIPMENR
jgi:inorganic pyrophosphatase